MKSKKKKTKLPKLNGRVAKNPSEVDCYNHIQSILPKGLKVVYEEVEIPYVLSKKYRPDYRISFIRGDQTLCFLEYKGNGKAFTPEVRQKMIAVKEQNPDCKFYIVFHSDGKCGPTRKDGTFLRQSDWARKHGFEFCIGWQNIPEEWFK